MRLVSRKGLSGPADVPQKQTPISHHLAANRPVSTPCDSPRMDQRARLGSQ